MAETWVIVTTDKDKMIDFAALAMHEGWLRTIYRVRDDERQFLRSDRAIPELFDQDAGR
jgi:hypothetical protein